MGKWKIKKLFDQVGKFICRPNHENTLIRNIEPKILSNTDGVVLLDYVVEDRANCLNDRVFIGKKSVLSCRIIFERDIGSVTIGHDTFIGGSNLICAENIDIGNNVLISWGCTIIDHDSHSLDYGLRVDDVRKWREGLLVGGFKEASRLKNWEVVEKAPIKIFDKVWIGMNVTILKGVSIGEGSVVATGSIVTKDVPPWTLVAGNPAKAIKDLKQGE